MRESIARKRIVSWLESEGWKVIPIVGSGRGLKGTPDMIVVKDGRHVWIETKSPTGKLAPKQIYEIAQLRKKGATVIVAVTVDDVREGLA